MRERPAQPSGCCTKTNRRAFLADCGMGLTGLVLGPMLQGDRAAANDIWTPPDGKPHFAPKAKRVIWLFMLGGVSHVESFDPKPALNKYSGKRIADTPFKDALDSQFVKENLKAFVPGQHKMQQHVYTLQSAY